jgi:hypothetical protein
MKSFRTFLSEEKRTFSKDQAKHIGDKLSVDWSKVDINQFILGLSVESEHDDGGKLDVVDSDADLAKIVLAHLRELPDYYSKLKKVEEEVPANSISGNGIAGLKEPIVFRKKRSTISRR